MRRVFPLLGLAAALVLFPGEGRAAPDVTWSFVDSVAACPGGDSVLAGRPARLRVALTYRQAPGGVPTPRAGAPPESIWVEWTPGAGDAEPNDQPGRAYADDSTDALGRARVTLPSLSGCGTLAFRLVVSGVEAGAGVATIRGADADRDGAVTAADACDLDFDGAVTPADAALRDAHVTHSHRHALFGTLVRRTSLCETCGEDGPGALGESTVSWSPDGRWLAFTIHMPPDGRCAAFLVPGDPADGDGLVQFTFPDSGVHDYDPVWSPRGDAIVFGRADNTIWSKGVPGMTSDTTLRLVTRHLDGSYNERGDVTPSFSPDGEWIAFSRKSFPATHWEIWKTPADGDTTRRVQLTFETNGDDFYPQWSTDGEWLLYQRIVSGNHSVWKVPSAGGAPVPVLLSGSGVRASTPAFAPDGRVIVAGVGPTITAETHTVDATLTNLALPSPRLVKNYPGFLVQRGFPVLSPRLSPDGTRLALLTQHQLWAARRNTSRPPRITSVGGAAVPAARRTVELLWSGGATLELAVEVEDPEGDPITLQAFFLKEGMSFDPGTRTLTWAIPDSFVGRRVVVRFQAATPSGGSDYALLQVDVVSNTGVGEPPPARLALGPARPNPASGACEWTLTLDAPAAIVAEVFDLQGRRVRALPDRAGTAGPNALRWDGRDERGRASPAGLYLLRVSAAGARLERRVVRLSP